VPVLETPYRNSVVVGRSSPAAAMGGTGAAGFLVAEPLAQTEEGADGRANASTAPQPGFYVTTCYRWLSISTKYSLLVVCEWGELLS
jgi:hypothetical protein